MSTYIVAVSNFYDKTNDVSFIIAENEMEAVILAAGRKNDKVWLIGNILLKKYKDVDSLKNHLSDYWGLGVSTPLFYKAV